MLFRSQGLKSGWDLRWLNRKGWDPAVVVDFASRLRFPRSFWTPLFHLSDQLSIQLPQGLPRPHQDWRQRWLDQAAARQMFRHREATNPLLRLGLYGLLAETHRQRLSLLLRLIGGDSAESPQARRLGLSRVNLAQLRRCFQEAWTAWRILRKS